MGQVVKVTQLRLEELIHLPTMLEVGFNLLSSLIIYLVSADLRVQGIFSCVINLALHVHFEDKKTHVTEHSGYCNLRKCNHYKENKRLGIICRIVISSGYQQGNGIEGIDILSPIIIIHIKYPASVTGS